MQELSPTARFSIRDMMRPGCILGIAGVLILAFAILRTAWGASHPDPDGLELADSGQTVKQMVWMVVGVGVTIFGALLSYIEYKRR